jgi:hypothetical protein
MSWDYSWRLIPSADRNAVLNASKVVAKRFEGVRFGAVVDPDLAEFAEEIEADDGAELTFVIPFEMAEAFDDLRHDHGPLEGEFHFYPAEDGELPYLAIHSNDGDNRRCFSALGEIVGQVAREIGLRGQGDEEVADEDDDGEWEGSYETFRLPFRELSEPKISRAVKRGLAPHRGVKVQSRSVDDEGGLHYVLEVREDLVDFAPGAREYEGPIEIELLFVEGDEEQRAQLCLDGEAQENALAWKLLFDIAGSISADLGGTLETDAPEETDELADDGY